MRIAESSCFRFAGGLSAAAAGIIFTCLTGCRGGDAVVEPKESAWQEVKAAAEENVRIREQVQAPEVWNGEFSGEGIVVRVNARVEVPDTEGFRLYKVVGRTFAAEEYRAVNRVLLNGAGERLYKKEETNAEGAPEWTKEEIDERIAALEEKIALGEEGKTVVGDRSLSYGEAVELWRERREKSPDLFDREVFSFEEALEAGKDSLRPNDRTGYVMVGEEEYCVHLCNDLYWDPEWRDIYFQVFSDEDYAGYRDSLNADEQQKAGALLKTAPQEITARAEALVRELGLEEYRVFGGEFVNMGVLNTPQEDMPGYAVHFTREAGGISVNYGNDNRSWIPEAGIHWGEEKLDVLYNDAGFVGLVWENPYEVEADGDRYVELLCFEQIQDVFMNMMLRKQEGTGGEGQKVEFDITEIRLGYMRSWEERERMEAALIPVWDFYGTREQSGTLPQAAQPYYSWLTINAMDGTVIER